MAALLALLESNPNPSTSAIMKVTYQRTVRERGQSCADGGAPI
jgi:hypothetical protein